MISMDASSKSALPAELRVKIYAYAVTSVLPIVVSINYYGGSTKNTLVLGHARLYTTHDLRALATNHEFREEMTNALYAKNVFDIALSREQPGKGICLSQIDIRRIRKCRLRINNMETNEYYPRMDVFWNGSISQYWHHQLRTLVATLVFHGHQIETMLVECQQQDPIWLVECLRPMAMLRNVGLVHFRSSEPGGDPYFRFLEARMMSNRPVPFANPQHFRIQTEPWQRRVAPPRSTDMTGAVVAKSKEEIEAMTRTLYAMLEIESRS